MVCSLVLGAMAVACADERGRVHIRLHETAPVSTREVLLHDIATITSPISQLSRTIGSIDVASLSPETDQKTVSASYVRIRLILAGWSKDQIDISGPDEVDIRYREAAALTDADIELAALETMKVVLNQTSDDLKVRLTTPVMNTMSQNLQRTKGLRAEVLPPLRTQTGSTSLTVRLWDGAVIVATRSARFDVLRRQRVAVTRVSLQRDDIVGERDVHFETRFLAVDQDEPDEDQVVGQRVRTTLGPGSILSLNDLADPPPQARPLVVHKRDKVRVTAVSGNVRVVLEAAEAMDAGRVGDAIRARNLQSGKIISGRISGPGRLEIKML
jgi:flagella basal body P-ring formation protein FlgA